MESTRKIVRIDEERCNGCGQCMISCAEGAIEVIDGKARLLKDSYCDGLGACIGECPRDALHIVEREADEFDPEAVDHHLKERGIQTKHARSYLMPSGCPSGNVQVFDAACHNETAPQAMVNSALSHWPIQIRLVPGKAPFLKGAHLLVAADCTAAACPNLHRDFLQGKVLLLGCPKFDNAREYVEKFGEIFRIAGIRSVTVLEMEVPCCSALSAIVRRGMAAAGREIPTEEVVISTRGCVVGRKQSVA